MHLEHSIDQYEVFLEELAQSNSVDKIFSHFEDLITKNVFSDVTLFNLGLFVVNKLASVNQVMNVTSSMDILLLNYSCNGTVTIYDIDYSRPRMKQAVIPESSCSYEIQYLKSDPITFEESIFFQRTFINQHNVIQMTRFWKDSKQAAKVLLSNNQS